MSASSKNRAKARYGALLLPLFTTQTAKLCHSRLQFAHLTRYALHLPSQPQPRLAQLLLHLHFNHV